MTQMKTLKVRVKDKHAAKLRQMAKSVNFTWNYFNELSSRLAQEKGVFLSAYDLHPYSKGAAKELGIHSQSIQAIAAEYVNRRVQYKKRSLKWRKSNGSRRSLGWIPSPAGVAKWKKGQIFYNGQYFSVWDSYGLSKYQFKSSSFNEDARGRWYFNVTVEAPEHACNTQGSVGIDLGLKDLATCSDGNKLASQRFYRKMEDKLAISQRSNNKKRTRAIHAKIKNRRKDAMHKFSSALVNQYAEIYVGNVSSTKLAKTNMAKSVYDAGWGQLKAMLEYKCDHAGTVFKEVCEAYTTQTCSNCGVMPESRPRGIAGLGIREWTCDACGVTHDRDVNAAKNILAVGHGRPVVGIPPLEGAYG